MPSQSRSREGRASSSRSGRCRTPQRGVGMPSQSASRSLFPMSQASVPALKGGRNNKDCVHKVMYSTLKRVTTKEALVSWRCFMHVFNTSSIPIKTQAGEHCTVTDSSYKLVPSAIQQCLMRRCVTSSERSFKPHHIQGKGK
ncbi:hypothetical protein UPYG_G00288200 [Umbra pygmaea]|uniref:Uncharacterized protein n=1 Tax=Umbra pygmaea TaxID=75934 RepID=A0ABD0WNR9_UMBPY